MVVGNVSYFLSWPLHFNIDGLYCVRFVSIVCIMNRKNRMGTVKTFTEATKEQVSKKKNKMFLVVAGIEEERIYMKLMTPKDCSVRS